MTLAADRPLRCTIAISSWQVAYLKLFIRIFSVFTDVGSECFIWRAQCSGSISFTAKTRGSLLNGPTYPFESLAPFECVAHVIRTHQRRAFLLVLLIMAHQARQGHSGGAKPPKKSGRWRRGKRGGHNKPENDTGVEVRTPQCSGNGAKLLASGLCVCVLSGVAYTARLKTTRCIYVTATNVIARVLQFGSQSISFCHDFFEITLYGSVAQSCLTSITACLSITLCSIVLLTNVRTADG